MNVTHKMPVEDPSLGSFTCEAICYRTEVENNHSFPIRIVWFQFFIEQDGEWCGYNVKNRVLREEDFEVWYTEGDPLDSGWLLPGAVAACDPNWHGGSRDCFPTVKWSFLAVDKKGNTYFNETVVDKECVKYVNKQINL